MSKRHEHNFRTFIYSVAMPDILGIKCECGKFVAAEDVANFVNELISNSRKEIDAMGNIPKKKRRAGS